MNDIQQQSVSATASRGDSPWRFAVGLIRKFYQTIGVLDPDGRPWMGRPVLVVTAAVLGALSVWAGHDLTGRYSELPPPDRVLTSAWRKPIEVNGWRELPAFPAANIRAAAIAPDGRLWIAGSRGLLAFSDNHGIDWTLLRHDLNADAFLAPGTNPPPANAAPTPGSLKPPDGPHSTGAAPPPKRSKPPGYATPGGKKPQVPPAQGVTPQQNRAPQPLTKPNQKPLAPKKASARRDSFAELSHLALASYKPANTGAVGPSDNGPAVERKSAAASGEPLKPISGKGLPIAPDTSSWEQPDLIAVGIIDSSIAEVFASDGRRYQSQENGKFWTLSRSAGAGAAQSPSEQGSSPQFPLSFRKAAEFSGLPGFPWKLIESRPKIFFDTDNFFGVSADNPRGTVEVYVGKQRLASWKAPDGWSVDSIAAGSGGRPLWILARNGEASRIFSSADQWKTSTTYSVALPLSDIVVEASGTRGYAVGANGAILGTADSGRHWAPLTRGAARPDLNSEEFGFWTIPLRLPPSWLYPFFLLAALVALPATLPVLRRGDRGIANLVVSDRPLTPDDPDPLNFKNIVAGLSGLLRNRDTSLPFSLAVNGKWGSGKSSLMNLLQHDLRASGLRTVWFNAWHHEDEPNLLASLLNAVRDAAPPPMASLWGTFYRLRLVSLRLFRQWRAAAVFVAILVFALRAEMVMHHESPEIYVHWSKNFLDSVTVVPGTTAQSPAAKQESQGSTGILAQLAKFSLNLACNEQPNADDCRSGKSEPNPGPASASNQPVSNEGIHWVTLLLGLIALLPKLDEILRSFKANPAELLATVSSGKKLADLEAQTNFRMKFARQFGEVTWALGRRRLVIFIDDLDRCRAEKIAQLLESVNYIMVSGESVVVLALEERAVRAGLGLNFARIAEEIEPDPSAAPSVPIPGSSGLLSETRQLHIDYARQYVDKLLNLVIQIPEPTPEQLIALATQARGAA